MNLRDLIPPEFHSGVSIDHHMKHGTPIIPGQDKYEAKAGVALPGDLITGISNPFVRKNPQMVARFIQSGILPPHLQQLALEAINIFEGFSAEKVSGGPKPFTPTAKETELPAFEDPVSNIWDRRD
jgi:hypothetical protein